jgi:hypothetical protein
VEKPKKNKRNVSKARKKKRQTAAKKQKQKAQGQQQRASLALLGHSLAKIQQAADEYRFMDHGHLC